MLGLMVAWMASPTTLSGAVVHSGHLGATSVGIIARVLSEPGCAASREACIILGAAIFDDVLGLISLAIVSRHRVSGSFQVMCVIAQILALSALFVVASLHGGSCHLRALIHRCATWRFAEAKIFVSLHSMGRHGSLTWSGLRPSSAPLAAGLIMNDCYFRDWEKQRLYSAAGRSRA